MAAAKKEKMPWKMWCWWQAQNKTKAIYYSLDIYGLTLIIIYLCFQALMGSRRGEPEPAVPSANCSIMAATPGANIIKLFTNAIYTFP
jgi:hypothetical protein